MSADAELIERARRRARDERKTLNAAFREWLAHYANPVAGAANYAAVMDQFRHVSAGRRFSRDEMNQR